MNLIHENFFGSQSLDRSEQLERPVSVAALPVAIPLKLNSETASLVDVLARDAFALQFKNDGGEDIAAPTQGVVIADDKTLAVLLRMMPGPGGYEPDAAEVRPAIAPTVFVYLDAAHNHHDAVRFEIPMTGKATATRMHGVEGFLACDSGRTDIPGRVPGWKSQSRLVDGIWHVLLRVDRKALSIMPTKARPVIGFQVQRVQSIALHMEYSCWSPPRVWPPIPTNFGDLRLAPMPVTVRAIDLRDPVHGVNRAVFEVTNTSAKPLKLTLRAATSAPSLKTEHIARHTLLTGATRRLELPWETSIKDWKHQYIDFSISAGKQVVYNAQYNAGSCFAEPFGAAYLLLRHRLPLNEKRNQPAPRIGDKRFYEKKRLYILSRIPDYRRDLKQPFKWIRGYVGNKEVVRFDLARPRVMDDIARHIETLFKSDDDRVLAAMYFVHQTGSWSVAFDRMCGFINPLTTLRLGYHACGSFVFVLCAILSRMTEQRTGKPFAAHYCCADSHVICGISRGEDHVLVDPNLGFFFPSPDCATLATAGQHHADKQIALAISPGRAGDYHKFPRRLFLPRTMHHFHGVGAPG